MSTAVEEINQQRLRREWESPQSAPDKPMGCDYGFVLGDESVCCDLEELIERVVKRGVPDVQFVWTPETPVPVPPEAAPELICAFRERAARAARREIYIGAGCLGFGLLLALIFRDTTLLYRNFFTVIGAVALTGSVWQLRRNRSYGAEEARADAGGARFDAWLRSQETTLYTKYVAACLIIVGVAQLIAGDKESIEAAGLVKPAVWRGQAWRLLTCTLMHANFTHFWLNFLALTQLSKLIERTTRRAYVPVVFLFSALCGSVFSLLLYPHTTSIGASGGLMGLMGFTVVAARADEAKYPPKYLRRLVEGIGFVALLGLFGFAFIDNAAHFGGLCGGALLGWMFLSPGNDRQSRVESWLTSLAGVSIIILGLTAAVAVWQMFR
jgi:membrane associated rhomboid family serine protease